MTKVLRELSGMSYTLGMGNVSDIRSASADRAQIIRAGHIHGLLKDERWSIRQAAARMGMTTSTLASRMRGETPFLADEIAMIADLLKRDAVDLYREYLLCAPRDLNPEPTGYGSAPAPNAASKPRGRRPRNTAPRGRAN